MIRPLVQGAGPIPVPVTIPLTIPKSEKARRRRIEIRGTDGQPKRVEAQTSGEKKH